MRGRGSGSNPDGRFERLDYTPDPEVPPEKRRATRILKDDSQTILSKNTSPDIPFDRSLNPYRGCEHGCAYCYARPTHEYLGFSAGLDFESRIVAKQEAPKLLRRELLRSNYKPSPLAMSGVTDCYQPIEKTLKITRGCLEVLAEMRHPVTIITKNALVLRDLDLLRELARFDAVRVAISVTSLDRELTSILEPRASSPRARLAAVEDLVAEGIPAGVMVAPIIPMLNEPEIPEILSAVAKAKAEFAGFTVVRLPWGVTEIFENWLEEHFPLRREKVMGRIRAMQGETTSAADFGQRIRGQGIFAEQIQSLFRACCRRSGLATGPLPRLPVRQFRKSDGFQQELELFTQ